jgi:hypothetical protein
MISRSIALRGADVIACIYRQSGIDFITPQRLPPPSMPVRAAGRAARHAAAVLVEREGNSYSRYRARLTAHCTKRSLQGRLRHSLSEIRFE